MLQIVLMTVVYIAVVGALPAAEHVLAIAYLVLGLAGVTILARRGTSVRASSLLGRMAMKEVERGRRASMLDRWWVWCAVGLDLVGCVVLGMLAENFFTSASVRHWALPEKLWLIIGGVVYLLVRHAAHHRATHPRPPRRVPVPNAA